MHFKSRHNDSGRLLIKRLAFLIAILYILSPFQQQISTVLHTLSHTLSSPEYIMTHTENTAKEEVAVHQFGDHRTSSIIHEHIIIDLVQTLLEGESGQGESPDPMQQTKPLDKHLVNYTYHLKLNTILFHSNKTYAPEQSTCFGHPNLWLEPPNVNLT